MRLLFSDYDKYMTIALQFILSFVRLASGNTFRVQAVCSPHI
jgi:hypothetical protein